MKKLILISGILCLVFTGLACQEDTAYQEESVISFNGLEWQIGPDEDMDYYDAKIWECSLEDDWRMPTFAELLGLYNAGIKEGDWGPFENSGENIWSNTA